ESKGAVELDALVVDHGETVVAGGRRAGEDTLADAIDQGFLQGVPAEGEEKQADAGPPVGRFVCRKRPFDASLRVATDDGSRVARRRHAGGVSPGGRLRRDDEPSRRHGKGFGEGVFYVNGVDRKQCGILLSASDHDPIALSILRRELPASPKHDHIATISRPSEKQAVPSPKAPGILAAAATGCRAASRSSRAACPR